MRRKKRRGAGHARAGRGQAAQALNMMSAIVSSGSAVTKINPETSLALCTCAQFKLVSSFKMRSATIGRRSA